MNNITKELRLLRKNIGKNIHDIRLKKKITLEKLSNYTKISTRLLDHYEMGKGEIGFNQLLKICLALKVGVGSVIK